MEMAIVGGAGLISLSILWGAWCVSIDICAAIRENKKGKAGKDGREAKE